MSGDKKIPGIDGLVDALNRGRGRSAAEAVKGAPDGTGAAAQQQNQRDDSSPYQSPFTRPVTDQSGLPIVGRPPIQQWPLGPMVLELPPDPGLDVRRLFQSAFNSETLNVTPEMAAAMAAWQAASLGDHQIRTFVEGLAFSHQQLLNGYNSLMHDYQELVKLLHDKGIIEAHVAEWAVSWMPSNDGVHTHMGEHGDRLLTIRPVVYRRSDADGSLTVFSHPNQVTGEEPTKEGFLVEIQGQWIVDGDRLIRAEREHVEVFETVDEAMEVEPPPDQFSRAACKNLWLGLSVWQRFWILSSVLHPDLHEHLVADDQRPEGPTEDELSELLDGDLATASPDGKMVAPTSLASVLALVSIDDGFDGFDALIKGGSLKLEAWAADSIARATKSGYVELQD